MSDGVPSPDEIIHGGAKPAIPRKVILVDMEGVPIPLSEKKAKAIGIILHGMAYVLVGIRPTLGDKGNPGADFLTVLDGDREHLRDAKGDMPGVIDRLYGREGIV